MNVLPSPVKSYPATLAMYAVLNLHYQRPISAKSNTGPKLRLNTADSRQRHLPPVHVCETCYSGRLKAFNVGVIENTSVLFCV